ncbi:uncharacterized protein BKA55DRAFT_564247 [Fusarium redolens]|uniref:Uncharacterized protein n=1 Tax=Fusarium redolens TaxID=48865 RepID=A0A9P9HDI3_FUSRE|nr:uncharacterized protein BKA55DRAFT_564247 [Fusarium redolens]KAH7255511.1 hypothetical protein BKA55DRAFT_564247 [Fusarium redolens]
MKTVAPKYKLGYVWKCLPCLTLVLELWYHWDFCNSSSSPRKKGMRITKLMIADSSGSFGIVERVHHGAIDVAVRSMDSNRNKGGAWAF